MLWPKSSICGSGTPLHVFTSCCSILWNLSHLPSNRYIKHSSRTTSSMKSLLMAPSKCNFPSFNCYPPHHRYFIGSVYLLHLIWRQMGLFPLLDRACLCRGRNSASFSCSFSLTFGEGTWVWSQERDLSSPYSCRSLKAHVPKSWTFSKILHVECLP